MARGNKRFRRNASPMALFDARQDTAYRVVWDTLCAAYGFEAANANYAQVRWICGDRATCDEILRAFDDWQSLEFGRRFIPFDRRLIKLPLAIATYNH